MYDDRSRSAGLSSISIIRLHVRCATAVCVTMRTACFAHDDWLSATGPERGIERYRDVLIALITLGEDS